MKGSTHELLRDLMGRIIESAEMYRERVDAGTSDKSLPIGLPLLIRSIREDATEVAGVLADRQKTAIGNN